MISNAPPLAPLKNGNVNLYCVCQNNVEMSKQLCNVLQKTLGLPKLCGIFLAFWTLFQLLAHILILSHLYLNVAKWGITVESSNLSPCLPSIHPFPEIRESFFPDRWITFQKILGSWNKALFWKITQLKSRQSKI